MLSWRCGRSIRAGNGVCPGSSWSGLPQASVSRCCSSTTWWGRASATHSSICGLLIHVDSLPIWWRRAGKACNWPCWRPGWLHGCLGLWISLRRFEIMQRAKPLLIAFVVIVPVAAALGFLRMAVEVSVSGQQSRQPGDAGRTYQPRRLEGWLDDVVFGGGRGGATCRAAACAGAASLRLNRNQRTSCRPRGAAKPVMPMDLISQLALPRGNFERRTKMPIKPNETVSPVRRVLTRRYTTGKPIAAAHCRFLMRRSIQPLRRLR